MPIKIFLDNKSAIELCRVLKTTQVKHINMRIHYINDLINRKVIELIFVPTDYNVADVSTKGLPYDTHTHIPYDTDILMNGHGGILMTWLLNNSMAMINIITDDILTITGVCHEGTSSHPAYI